MVRASTNEPAEDKKETTKKKAATRKKTVVTGVWPCKINGCNKQFAREADLKRHQRTTKSHSVPGFACPQCDATFTRTDALRRHQKSRHNGVVIEPSEQDAKEQTEDGSSATQSKSRSTTPSSKGKERATALHPQPPAQTNRSGPSSYYRQHTATTTGPYPLRPTMNPPYQIGLPTSSTRSDVAPNWAYPQPWAPSTQMAYQPIYYPPHYRPNGTAPPPGLPPGPPSHQRAPQGAPLTQTQETGTSSGPVHQASNDTKPSINGSNSISGGDSSSAPVIDTSLDHSDDTTLTAEQVLEITQAAVQAVLEAQAEHSKAQKRAGSSSSTTGGGDDDDEDLLLTRNMEDNSNTMHGYGLPLERPEPMEHMLTEDGEPMLNPAELLTQESLASPPPS